MSMTQILCPQPAVKPEGYFEAVDSYPHNIYASTVMFPSNETYGRTAVDLECLTFIFASDNLLA
jgi:hypothetical protein